MKASGIAPNQIPKPIAVANAPKDGARYGTEIDVGFRSTRPKGEGIRK